MSCVSLCVSFAANWASSIAWAVLEFLGTSREEPHRLSGQLRSSTQEAGGSPRRAVPSCPKRRCATGGTDTRERRPRVPDEARKSLGLRLRPRLCALVLRPQLVHPLSIALTVEVGVVVVHLAHLLSPLVVDWASTRIESWQRGGINAQLREKTKANARPYF